MSLFWVQGDLGSWCFDVKLHCSCVWWDVLIIWGAFGLEECYWALMKAENGFYRQESGLWEEQPSSLGLELRVDDDAQRRMGNSKWMSLLIWSESESRRRACWCFLSGGWPPSSSLPVLDVVFQVSSGQFFSAVLCEGAGDHQLVQQLVHQQAGLPAALQHEGGTAHGAEIAFQQEAGQALLAVGVSTGRVQRPDERLQADLADQIVVHLVLVQVLVVLLQPVTSAACGTQVGRRRQQSEVGWGERLSTCLNHRGGAHRLSALLVNAHGRTDSGGHVGTWRDEICSENLWQI